VLFNITNSKLQLVSLIEKFKSMN